MTVLAISCAFLVVLALAFGFWVLVAIICLTLRPLGIVGWGGGYITLKAVFSASYIERLIYKLIDATWYVWKVDDHAMECHDRVFMYLIGEGPKFVVNPVR